ncbi:MAG: hypothetical protein ACSHW7_01335 [Patiriisocius sp.]|uniref:hypothetical protein n=1 Tax=Patiriisocius sp. TaxID=2822396 RepID=UPI003EF99722
MLEYGSFNSLLDKNEFRVLDTGQKIEFLVKKDIFSVGYRGETEYNKYSCIDLSKLNFKIFKNEVFKIWEFYESNNYCFHLNPLVVLDAISGLNSSITLSYDYQQKNQEIDFQLDICINDNQKLEYLRDKIKNYNPFSNKEIIIEYSHRTDFFEFDNNEETNFPEKYPKFIIEWIHGYYGGQQFNPRLYSYLEEYFEESMEMHITNFCLYKIREIQGLNKPMKKAIFTTPLQIVQLLAHPKVGMLNEISLDLNTQEAIANILNAITAVNTQNLRQSIGMLNKKTSQQSKSYFDNEKKIEAFLNTIL